MPFNFENNTFQEDETGVIETDRVLTTPEIRELQEMMQVEANEIHDTTQGELDNFLKTDVVPQLKNLPQNIRESVKKLLVARGIEVAPPKTEIPAELVSKFQIQNPEDIAALEDALKGFGVEGGITKLLSEYDHYISEKLGALSPEILGKIYASIGIRVGNLSGVIYNVTKTQMAHSEEGPLSDYRWMVNAAIQDSFHEINTKILPSALLLNTWKTNPESVKVSEAQAIGLDPKTFKGKGVYSTIGYKIRQIEEMFAADLDESGEFDETGFESVNQTDTLILERETDARIFSGIGGNPSQLEGISLLSEEDKKIEAEAMLWFMGAIAGQIAIEGGPAVLGSIIPGAGTAAGAIVGNFLGAGIDITDTFSHRETLLVLLQKGGIVPKEYKMNKTILDNILAGIGLVPGATLALKSAKLAKLMRKFGFSGEQVLGSMEKVLPVLKGENGAESDIGKIPIPKSKPNTRANTPDSPANLDSAPYTISEDGKRISIGVAPDSILEANGKLDDTRRITKAEELLGFPLTDRQKELLLQAHNIEQGYNVQKGKILMSEGGFTRNQAQILMDQGIAGIFDFGKRNPEIPKGIEYGKMLEKIDGKQLQVGDKLQIETRSGSRYEFTVIRIDNGIPYMKWSGGGEALKGVEGPLKNGEIKIGEQLLIGKANTSSIKSIQVMQGEKISDISIMMEGVKSIKPDAQAALQIEDFRPIKSIKIGEQTFFASKVINGGSRSIAFVYIKEGGVLKTRIFYKSQSDGGWRLNAPIGAQNGGQNLSKGLPGYNGGYRHYTRETKPHEDLCNLLDSVPAIHNPKLYDFHTRIRDLYKDGENLMEYSQETIFGGIINSLSRIGRNGEGVSGGVINGKLDIDMVRNMEFPKGFIPDFSRGPEKSYKTSHTLLSQKGIDGKIIQDIQINVFKSVLGDGKTEILWHFASDKQGRIWIDRIEVPGLSYTNSFGVSSKIFDFGILDLKPIDYGIGAGKNNQLSGIPDNYKRHFNGEYDDITPFLAELKPIREYKQWLMRR